MAEEADGEVGEGDGGCRKEQGSDTRAWLDGGSREAEERAQCGMDDQLAGEEHTYRARGTPYRLDRSGQQTNLYGRTRRTAREQASAHAREEE